MGYKDIKEFFETYKNDPVRALLYLAVLVLLLLFGYIIQHFDVLELKQEKNPDNTNKQTVLIQPPFNSTLSLKPQRQPSTTPEPHNVPYYNQKFIGSWLINQQETEKRCIQESGEKANLTPDQIDFIIFYPDHYFSLPHIKPIREGMVSDFRIKISANAPKNIFVRFIEPNLKSPVFNGRPLENIDRIEFATSEKNFFYIDFINWELYHERIMLSGNLSELKNFSHISKLPCTLIILDKEISY